MKAKKKVKKFNKISILVVLVLVLIITTVIIYAQNIQPTSEAATTTITVTYKVGDGTYVDDDGNEQDSVTYTQTVYGQQTQGTYDYTDGKVVLKSNSELGFTHENTTYDGLEYEMILTGWKLTSVTQDGTKITTFVEPENQNYADPSDAAKDIDTVYAQEGWYVVPDGVTSITVEAVYGRAIYIRSPYDTMYYDEYHIFYYGENDDGTTSLDGTATPYSSDSNYGTSEDDAVATLKRAYALMTADSSLTVYDTVFLLCGDLWEVNYNTAGSSYVPSSYTEDYEAYTSDAFGYNTSTKKPVTISSTEGNTYKFTLCPGRYSSYFYSGIRFDAITQCVVASGQKTSLHGTSVSTYNWTPYIHCVGIDIWEMTENTTRKRRLGF